MQTPGWMSAKTGRNRSVSEKLPTRQANGKERKALLLIGDPVMYIMFIVFAVFFRCYAEIFLKLPCKVVAIVKTAFFRYFGDAGLGLSQQETRMLQSELYYVINWSSSIIIFKHSVKMPH